MNRNNQRKLAKLYLRQGIICLILLGLTIYLDIVSSLTRTLFPPVIDNISDLASQSYMKDHPIVQINCDTLYYTGYDNYLKEEVTGHYYYTIQDRVCLFVLLDKSKDAPEETINNFKGTLKIVEDEAVFNNLAQNLSQDMEWSVRGLQEISLPVIASQPDYHFLPTAVLTIGMLICFVVFGYGTISNLYYYYRYF